MSHANGDAAVPRYRGTRLLRLVTTTAEGGQRTTTLPYLPDEERHLLIAVDAPAWYADLLDLPRATVEQGSSPCSISRRSGGDGRVAPPHRLGPGGGAAE